MLRRYQPIDLPLPEDALPGRPAPVEVPDRHEVLGTPLRGPWPEGLERAAFGMGCFWGTEKFMWRVEGVYSTFVGYTGGHTPNPTYDEVCSGGTGHNEVAVVVFDPSLVTYERLLKEFWEMHDPTQYMGQGNDIGTQYRSGIYTYSAEQQSAAIRSRERYQEILDAAGFGRITTEIRSAGEFYYGEPYHQQYLAKNPWGYCNHGLCQARYS